MSVVGFAKCCRDIPSGNRVGDAVIVIKGKDLRDSLRQALRIFGHHIQGDDRISVRVHNMEAFLHEIVVFPIRILAVALPPHDKVLQCIIAQATENG